VSRGLTIAVAAVTVIALGVWAVSELADSDPPERRGSGLAVHLSDEQAEEVERIALESEDVQRLAEGRDPEVVNTIVREDSENRITGANVEIRLTPEIAFFKATVPARVKPGPDAPPGTPDLDRKVRYEAENVSVLRTWVDLGEKRLIEVVPDGPEAEVHELRILGPKLQKYYNGKAD
jgi:hypothetical protein